MKDGPGYPGIVEHVRGSKVRVVPPRLDKTGKGRIKYSVPGHK